MTEREFDAISRLEAWVRDFGDQKPPEFITDVETVLAMAREYGEMTETVSSALKTDTYTIATYVGCTCHERDSSSVCEYCKALGYRGHMEATVIQ